ncbi:MAG TPA: hypothetical protein VLC72_00810 [Nitrosopumilaceae archaeon]|nr:hypothetical protein [Nitrosopumilaceae archaeon]
MLIKLIIIGVILLGGGIVFANEINQFLPVTSANLLDSTESNFGKIKDETVHTTETKVEGALVTVNKGINDFKDSSTELLSKNVNDVTESTQNGLKGIAESTHENIKKITESTQKTVFGGNNNQKQNSDQMKEEDDDDTIKTDNENVVTETINENVVTKPNNENTISFETLSLTTIQQADDRVMLQYKDTSGKTISVSVILRTPERELFSGIFYSSMFETFVNDASNTSYFIDMIVEHKEYGTISSSVYNPGNSPNTIINGVFSKS